MVVVLDWDKKSCDLPSWMFGLRNLGAVSPVYLNWRYCGVLSKNIECVGGGEVLRHGKDLS